MYPNVSEPLLFCSQGSDLRDDDDDDDGLYLSKCFYRLKGKMYFT